MTDTKQLDTGYVQHLVQEVLDRSFPPGSEKRRALLKRGKGLEMACPICGDSNKNPRAKRGILFFGSLTFKCMNEGCSGSLTSLCRERDVAIDPEKRMEMFAYLDQQATLGAFARHGSHGRDDGTIASLDKLIPMEALQAWFDESNGFLVGFGPMREKSVQFRYLTERGIPPRVALEEFYMASLVITESWHEHVVVFLNRSGDGRVLGMQVRNLLSGDKRRFKIYNFEHLYNCLHPDAPLDPIEAVAYNKLSYLFNILRVDLDRPVHVLEGLLDAVFAPNSIGAVGTETDFGFLTGEGIEVRFMFDNDGAGRWKAQAYMRKGHKVFLWDRFVEEKVRSLPGDPAQNHRALSAVKDLNALAKASGTADPFQKLDLERYFSHGDVLDALWIPGQTKAEGRAFYERKKNKGQLAPSADFDAMLHALHSIK